MVGLGALGGVVSALFAEGFKAFTKHTDRKHELKLLELQKEIGERETEREVIVATLKTDERSVRSAREHDMFVTKTSLWVANLRASLRPCVTYMVILLAFILFFSSPGAVSEIQSRIIESFMVLMEATTTFWFAGRAMGRERR